MNYVESFNLFGVEAMQLPCIRRSGAPTAATEGEDGLLYMNTDNGDFYKYCWTGSSYEWTPLVPKSTTESKRWEKIQDIEVAEDVGYLFFNKDSSGEYLKNKNYTKVYVFIKSAAQQTASSGELMVYVNVYREEHDSRPRASAGNNFIKSTTEQNWKAIFDIDNGLCLFGIQGLSNESWSENVQSTPDAYQLFTRGAEELYEKQGFINNIKIKSNVGIPAGTKIQMWAR